MSLVHVSLTNNSDTATEGWENVRNKMIAALKEQEATLSGNIRSSVEETNPLMNLPEYIRNELSRLETLAISPEQQKYVVQAKRNVLALHEARADNIREKVAMNINKMNFEFAMKAISKTVSAIQQVLASQ